MKYSKLDIERLPEGLLYLDEKVLLPKFYYQVNERILDVLDVYIEGKGRYEPHLERFDLTYYLEATVVTPCAITLEHINYDIGIEVNESYSFIQTDDDTCIIVSDDIDLYESIYTNILCELPIKVVSQNATYTKGEGWEVINENLLKKDVKIDERLQKFKEYIDKKED